MKSVFGGPQNHFVPGLAIGSFLGLTLGFFVAKKLLGMDVAWETLVAGALGAGGGYLAFRAGMIQAETTRKIYEHRNDREMRSAALAVRPSLDRADDFLDRWSSLWSEGKTMPPTSNLDMLLDQIKPYMHGIPLYVRERFYLLYTQHRYLRTQIEMVENGYVDDELAKVLDLMNEMQSEIGWIREELADIGFSGDDFD